MPTRTFSGQYESLARICEFVTEIAQEAGLNEVDTYSVQLAVDEACSNVIEHAYGGEGVGDIQCACNDTGEGLAIVIRDRGQSFDPDSVPEPPKNERLEDLKLRGAGLYLIRKLMDEVRFEFSSDEGNTLTMIKRKERAPQSDA